MDKKFNLTVATIKLEDVIKIVDKDLGKCKVGIELERCLEQLKEIIKNNDIQ